MKSTISFPALLPFEMKVAYAELDRDDPSNVHDSHVHPECEIYINLSGDVSFMVENRIYPIMPGNIVISRPYEYHHCIYHSGELHRHFWILFSLPTDSGEVEKELFGKFFERLPGHDNPLSLGTKERDELISICHELSRGNTDGCRSFSLFFRVIELISSAKTVTGGGKTYPSEIDSALAVIDGRYSDASLSVSEIASEAGVSVNTLERHFRSFFSMSPLSYLKKKRLAAAAELLFRGSSVSEAAEASGFSDYSHFIALFKNAYGITPLKYKKATKSSQ